MAKLLYISTGTQHGRGIVFGKDVVWIAVHKDRLPCVAVITDAGTTQLDNRNGATVEQLLVKLECLLDSGEERLMDDDENDRA